MKLSDIEWREFAKRSLSASLLAEHNYCAAKVYNKRELGEVETPLTLAGTEIHEQELGKIVKSMGPSKAVQLKTLLDAMALSLKNIKLALKRKRALANSGERKFALMIIPELGLYGLPDIVDASDGEQPIIIDIKTTNKLPERPWFNDKLQVAVYVMGLQRLGFQSKYGILRYQLRNDKNQTREFRVDVDESLKQHVVDAMKDILRIINGGEPIPTDKKNKCIPCGYRNSCKWSLAKMCGRD